ncbi:MAG: Oligopeptide transport system permease protein OppB, partial [uncultured Thermomicrobiales bacterium]
GPLHPRPAARPRLRPPRRQRGHLLPDPPGAGRPLRGRRARPARGDPGRPRRQVRVRPARLAAVPQLPRQRRPRRLRRPLPGADDDRRRADQGHLAGHDPDRPPDDRDLLPARHPARLRCRRPPQFVPRLFPHLRFHPRPGAAQLRRRHLVDPPLRGPPRLAADRRLGQAGALRPAGARLQPGADGVGRPLHPDQPGRHPRRRPRPDRPRQGALEHASPDLARRPQRPDPLRHRYAAGDPQHPDRLDLHRAGVSNPRARPLLRHLHLHPRLPDDPGAGPPGRGRLGRHLPPDRPPLHPARPPDPAV